MVKKLYHAQIDHLRKVSNYKCVLSLKYKFCSVKLYKPQSQRTAKIQKSSITDCQLWVLFKHIPSCSDCAQHVKARFCNYVRDDSCRVSFRHSSKHLRVQRHDSPRLFFLYIFVQICTLRSATQFSKAEFFLLSVQHLTFSHICGQYIFHLSVVECPRASFNIDGFELVCSSHIIQHHQQASVDGVIRLTYTPQTSSSNQNSQR